MKSLFFAFLFFFICALVYPLEIIKVLDIKVTLFFETIRTPFLTEMFLFISDIGSIKSMLPLCFICALILLLKRKVIDALFIFIMFYSVRQLNYLLKELFRRERPSFNAVYEASHFSFPSGHTMNSTAIFSFICFLFMIHIIKNKNYKNGLLISTISLIGLIGISRIYLGVHYLTDVLAGFSAGGAWFIVISIFYMKTRKSFDKNRRF